MCNQAWGLHRCSTLEFPYAGERLPVSSLRTGVWEGLPGPYARRSLSIDCNGRGHETRQKTGMLFVPVASRRYRSHKRWHDNAVPSPKASASASACSGVKWPLLRGVRERRSHQTKRRPSADYGAGAIKSPLTRLAAPPRAGGHKAKRLFGRDFPEPQKIAIVCLKFGVHPGNVG